MAIVYHEGKLVLFAHVPKAGGTSVERLLKARYDTVGLHDTNWRGKTSYLTSFATSPMHILARDLDQLYPEGSLDYAFAVVRDPLRRTLSSYRYHQNKGLRRKLAQIGFSNWLDIMLSATERVRSFTDNHLRPQSELVPARAEAFRLEEGLDKVADRLAEILGPGRPGAELTHANKSKGRAAGDDLSAEDVARIVSFYAADYERFGYDKPDPATYPSRPRSPITRFLCRQAAKLLAFAYKRRLIN